MSKGCRGADALQLFCVNLYEKADKIFVCDNKIQSGN